MTSPEEIREFVDLFNQQKFFEAHETLELLWRREKGEPRDFYQGLIQIAAVFVHLQKGTPGGGEKILETARGYLEKYRPVYQGLDIDHLLRQTRESFAEGAIFPRLLLV